MVRIGEALLLVALAAGCGSGGGFKEMFGLGDSFDGADADADYVVTPAEFTDWSREIGLYEGWHVDELPGFSREEVAAGLYNLLAAGAEGLQPAEWGAYMAAWFPSKELGTFEEWDLNSDGRLERSEFIAGFEQHDLLAGLQADENGRYDEGILNAYIYSLVDTNADGKVNEAEWDRGLERLRL